MMLPTVLIESEFLIWSYSCASCNLDLITWAREERVHCLCIFLKWLRFYNLYFLNKLETKNYPQRLFFKLECTGEICSLLGWPKLTE